MNHDEAVKMAQKLGSLFQPLTQAQAKLAIAEFEAFSRGAVEKAIDQHRKGGGTREGFIDWPQLFEGCRAAEASGKSTGKGTATPTVDLSWADVYRKRDPALAQAGDYEVCLRVHRGWWIRSSRSIGYRALFLSGCRSTLISLGMEIAAAACAAEAILHSPEMFRLALQDLRDNVAKPPAVSNDRERVVDFVKRVDPRTLMMGETDTIEFHFREAWRLAQESGSPQGRDAARATIVSNAVNALDQLRYAPEKCIQMARDYAELRPGENVVKRLPFKQPPSSPPASAEALEKLARAELAERQREPVPV